MILKSSWIKHYPLLCIFLDTTNKNIACGCKFLIGISIYLSILYVCMYDLHMESYDQPRQHIEKQRHYFANKGPSS